MRVTVVFASFVMLIVLAKRSQMLQPLVDILDQSALIIVHVDAGRDVHGGDEHHALLNAALGNDFGDLRSDVHVSPAGLRVEFKVLGERFHSIVVPPRAALLLLSPSQSIPRSGQNLYT